MRWKWEGWGGVRKGTNLHLVIVDDPWLMNLNTHTDLKTEGDLLRRLISDGCSDGLRVRCLSGCRGADKLVRIFDPLNLLYHSVSQDGIRLELTHIVWDVRLMLDYQGATVAGPLFMNYVQET